MKREQKKNSQQAPKRPGGSAPARRVPRQPERSNTVKDPNEWTTGDEEMTGAQHSYLKTLSEEAGEELDDNLSKAATSKKIDELQQKTGRGKDH